MGPGCHESTRFGVERKSTKFSDTNECYIPTVSIRHQDSIPSILVLPAATAAEAEEMEEVLLKRGRETGEQNRTAQTC